MNWHQAKAARDNYRLRNVPAHVAGLDWIPNGKAICGKDWKDVRVYVYPHEAHNPNNKTCKQCLKEMSRGKR